MLVIHPKDKTTAMLSTLYDGLEAQVVADCRTTKEMGHPHTYHLRKHGGNIVAVWCNADQFARAEGLHGLFTGMIVSELSEALLYQVETTQEELDRENVKLAIRLRTLFDERIPLNEIPKRMLAMDDVHSPLTTFNYKNFFYF